MNYLAHLFLAEDTPEALIGNLLGDFVKNRDRLHYSEAIQIGIRLHHQIDSYTDSHPSFLAAKRFVAPERRRFSGILVDVFYDHLLAKHWHLYSPISLQQFTDRVYGVLQKNQAILPATLQSALDSWIALDLLGSYCQMTGVETALQRISYRIKRQNTLAQGVEDLLSHYQDFEISFFDFFPDLIAFAKSQQHQVTQA